MNKTVMNSSGRHAFLARNQLVIRRFQKLLHAYVVEPEVYHVVKAATRPPSPSRLVPPCFFSFGLQSPHNLHLPGTIKHKPADITVPSMQPLSSASTWIQSVSSVTLRPINMYMFDRGGQGKKTEAWQTRLLPGGDSAAGKPYQSCVSTDTFFIALRHTSETNNKAEKGEWEGARRKWLICREREAFDGQICRC